MPARLNEVQGNRQQPATKDRTYHNVSQHVLRETSELSRRQRSKVISTLKKELQVASLMPTAASSGEHCELGCLQTASVCNYYDSSRSDSELLCANNPVPGLV
jgi:hypothetical protein